MFILLTWVHLLAAMVWIGGMLFLTLVLAPVMREEPFVAQRRALFRTVALRFRTMVWTAIGLLVATGPVLMSQRVASLGEPSSWPFMLKLKLLLVVAMIGFTMLHDLWLGPLVSRVKRTASEGLDPSRNLLIRITPWIARLALLLGLAVLLTAVALVRT
jgi:uncharacterized membrane protein